MFEILDYCFYCKKRSKYICPKCKINYCSISCFANPDHQDCSEKFYKNNVLEANKINENELDSFLKCQKLFSPNLFIDDEDNIDEDNIEPDEQSEEDGGDIHERLKNIDLDDSNAILAQLNQKEKEQFEIAIKNNEPWLINLIPKWEPWWYKRVPSKYKSDRNADIKDLFKEPFNIPELKQFNNTNIKSDNNINKSIIKGSPLILNNIVNLLLGYIYVTRLYNGDHVCNCEEAIQIMIQLTTLTKPDFKTFDSLKQALHIFYDNLLQLELLEGGNMKTTKPDNSKDNIINKSSSGGIKHSTLSFITNKTVSNNQDSLRATFFKTYLPDLLAILKGGPSDKMFQVYSHTNSIQPKSARSTIFIEAGLSDIYDMFNNYNPTGIPEFFNNDMIKHNCYIHYKTDNKHNSVHQLANETEVTFLNENKVRITPTLPEKFEIRKILKKLDYYIVWVQNLFKLHPNLLAESIIRIENELENIKSLYEKELIIQQNIGKHDLPLSSNIKEAKSSNKSFLIEELS